MAKGTLIKEQYIQYYFAVRFTPLQTANCDMTNEAASVDFLCAHECESRLQPGCNPIKQLLRGHIIYEYRLICRENSSIGVGRQRTKQPRCGVAKRARKIKPRPSERHGS